MIYRGSTPLRVYKGDHKSANVYWGNTKVAGWVENTASGETVEFSNTYNDFVDVLLTGKTEQAVTTQNKNTLDATKCSLAFASYTLGTIVSANEVVIYNNQTGPEGTLRVSYARLSIGIVAPGISHTLSALLERVLGDPLVVGNIVLNIYRSASPSTHAGGTVLGGFNSTSVNKKLTFVTTVEQPYVHLLMYSQSANTATKTEATARFYDMQLEVGVVTSYAPFVPNSPSPDYPSTVNSAGGNLVSKNTTTEIPYMASTWIEWSRSVGVDANSSGLKLTSNGSAYIISMISANFKAITKYGIMFNVVSNSLTKGFTIDPNVYIGAGKAYTAMSGNQKQIFTSRSTIAINKFKVTTNSAEEVAGLFVLLKNIQIFELPTGSQIEADFANLTADQLAIKYQFISKENIKSTTAIIPMLRKVDTVADTYNTATREYVQRIGVKTFRGLPEENWVQYMTFNTYYRAFNDCALGYQTSICTHFKNVNGSWGSILPTYCGLYSDHYLTSHNKYFNMAGQILTLADWLLWLAANPITVLYQLATPITTIYPSPIQLQSYYPYTHIETNGVVKADITATAKIMEVSI